MVNISYEKRSINGQKQKYETLKLIVILSVSMLTIMGSAAVAPALPEMLEYFANVPNASLLVSLVVTLPALAGIVRGVIFGVASIMRIVEPPVIIPHPIKVEAKE